ncbi:MAG: hypothetical protein AAF726_16695 [Planctomycetota bacterium]
MLSPLAPAPVQGVDSVPLLQLADVQSGDSAQGPVRRAVGVSGFDSWVLEASPAGGLVRTGALPGLSGRALGETRAVGLGPGFLPQVWERTAAGWSPGPDLGLMPVLGTFVFGGLLADIDGERAIVRHATERLMAVYDLSTPGQAILEWSQSISTQSVVIDLALDGDTAVLLFADVAPTSAFTNVSVRVLERGAAGWSETQVLAPPAGIDWSRATVRSMDADNGRIVVGAPVGVVGDPCGRVIVYERGAAGDYVVADVVRPTGRCAIAPDSGGFFGSLVDLAGDELAVIGGLDRVGERFERTSTGWVRRERVIASESQAIYYAFGGRLLAQSSLDIELLEPVDSLGIIDVACSSLSSATVSGLFVSGRDPDQPSVREYGWGTPPEFDGQTHFFVLGTSFAQLPVGPSAELCVGGALNVVPFEGPFQGLGLVGFRFVLDTDTLGLPVGSKVFAQGWRREPGLVGGRTTNALAIPIVP